MVPVQVPATVPTVSYESSVFGSRDFGGATSVSQLQLFRFRKRLVMRLRTGECEVAQGFGWGVRDTYITFT